MTLPLFPAELRAALSIYPTNTPSYCKVKSALVLELVTAPCPNTFLFFASCPKLA